jgi:endoglycosylceramidase
MGSTGQIKIDDAKPPTPGNIRRERLDAVVRPYPQLVAGTPLEYGWDGERFELAFSTRSAAASGFEPVGGDPGPRRFGRGSRSEIVVPRARFPGGYGVEVEGARAVSRHGGRLLVLRTCPHVRRVEVSVARGIGPPSGCVHQA